MDRRPYLCLLHAQQNISRALVVLDGESAVTGAVEETGDVIEGEAVEEGVYVNACSLAGLQFCVEDGEEGGYAFADKALNDWLAYLCLRVEVVDVDSFLMVFAVRADGE